MPLYVIINCAMKDNKATPSGGYCCASSLEQAKEVAAQEVVRCCPPEQGWTDHQHGAVAIPMSEILSEAKAIRDRLDNPDKPIPLAFQPVESMQEAVLP